MAWSPVGRKRGPDQWVQVAAAGAAIGRAPTFASGDYPSRASDPDWYEKWYESKNHARLESGDYPSGASDPDWYEKWYESKNHARLASTVSPWLTLSRK